MFGRDIMPPGLHDFASTPHDSAVATTTITLPTPPVTCGFDAAEGAGCIGGDPFTGRWPRQETLTLLEIRSRLDPKFKEANHKGPLWDEVSRYNASFILLEILSFNFSNANYIKLIKNFLQMNCISQF